MANLQSLLRQVLGFIRKNPDKAQRHLHTAGDTIKKRTGGKYNRHIDKAISGASKYLGKQSGRPEHGAPGNRDGHRPEGSTQEHRPDGHDHRRDR